VAQAEQAARAALAPAAHRSLAKRRGSGEKPEPAVLFGHRLRPGALPDPEEETLALEIRLRCTEGMLLSLDREARLAFVLGEIFELSGDDAAQVLELEPAAYRKRLSRARQSLLSFMREPCGVYDEQNACRCKRQVAPALAAGRLERADLPLARHPLSADAKRRLPMSVDAERVQRGAREVSELMRVADVMRGHPDYATPARVLQQLRELLAAGRFELLRD